MARTALVLGGGGVAGIAWQTGVLHGLAESGVDVTAREWSDMLLGTSAGAAVAAQVTSGALLSELYLRQVGSGKADSTSHGPMSRSRH